MLRKLNSYCERIDPDLMSETNLDYEESEPIGDGQFSVLRSFWPIRRENTEDRTVAASSDLAGSSNHDEPNSSRRSSDADTNDSIKSWDTSEGKAFSLCFSYLRPDDLKACRLVCRKWREKANEKLKEKSAVVINGDQNGGWFTDGSTEKCIKYLKNSVTKFSLWRTMRLTKVRDFQMKALLASRDFQIAVKSIEELQMDRCEMSWNSLLKVLKQFINLKIFMDKKSKYTDTESSSVMSSLAIWNSSAKTPSAIETNFVKKDICLEDLKCLKIFKNDAGKNTTDLIKILTVTTVDLEEIHLKLDPQNLTATIKDIFEFERHLNILFVLNMATLKKLYVDMMDSDHIEYFNDFLKIFRDWSGSDGKESEFAMEELILKFKYVWLSKSFETILIPYVAKLKHLKVFGLGSVSFKPAAAYLLETIRSKLPEGCTFEFGICVTDHPHHDSSEEAQASRALGVSILKSSLYKKHMTDLLIGIFHDEVQALSGLIPKELEGPGYLKTVDVCIFTEGPYRPNFKSFDIKLLCFQFSNVTNLEIIDGPYDNYFQAVFSKTSEASIGDEDIQCILKNMGRLQKLILFANMETLTDSGVTGLPTMLCYRMRTTKQYRLDPIEIQGQRFGSLKDLRYLSLRGIGTSLTDVSAYWGFSNVKNLKTLIIAHFKKLSPEGRKHLDDMYPASKGCFVAIL